MASFIMKQMMGSQLDKVKGILSIRRRRSSCWFFVELELTGGDGDKKDGGDGDEEDPEVKA